jgi:D-aminoacyl-tRNA deacylase
MNSKPQLPAIIQLNSHDPVSQFTLLASTRKGNKPDFHNALGGDEAKRLYQYFVQKVREGSGAVKVEDGVFQAMMEV